MSATVIMNISRRKCSEMFTVINFCKWYDFYYNFSQFLNWYKVCVL